MKPGNDIYNIRVRAVSGTDVLSEERLNNIAGVNTFIRRTRKLKEFAHAQAELTVCPCSNGPMCSVGAYRRRLFYYLELTPAELDALEKDIRDFFLWTGVSGTLSERDPKKGRLREYAYVCEHCFNGVEECTCESYPWHLIQIDRLLLPVVRSLNEKGYATSECCAGHPDLGYGDGIYITFRAAEQFDSLPGGFRYVNNTLSTDFPELSVKEKLEYRDEHIKKLSVWVEKL